MGDIIADIFAELLPGMIRRLGAGLRWLFLRKKYSYEEILDKNGNLLLGLAFLVLVVVGLMYLL